MDEREHLTEADCGRCGHTLAAHYRNPSCRECRCSADPVCWCGRLTSKHGEEAEARRKPSAAPRKPEQAPEAESPAGDAEAATGAESCGNHHGPDGVIACWSPGGPCPGGRTVCESCGPCGECRPGEHPMDRQATGAES